MFSSFSSFFLRLSAPIVNVLARELWLRPIDPEADAERSHCSHVSADRFARGRMEYMKVPPAHNSLSRADQQNLSWEKPSIAVEC